MNPNKVEIQTRRQFRVTALTTLLFFLVGATGAGSIGVSITAIVSFTIGMIVFMDWSHNSW